MFRLANPAMSGYF